MVSHSYNFIAVIRSSDFPVYSIFTLIYTGYPREQSHLDILDGILSDLDRAISACIYLDVPEEVLRQRLTGRLVCSGCGVPFIIFPSLLISMLFSQMGEVDTTSYQTSLSILEGDGRSASERFSLTLS